LSLITTSNTVKQLLLQVPRPIKQAIAVASDMLVLVFATAVSMDLRAEQMLAWSDVHTWMAVCGALLAVPIFTLLGLYRAIFRWAGLQVLYTLNKALLIYGIFFAAIFALVGVAGVPKSMGLIQPVIFAMGVTASRLLVRRWLGGFGHLRQRSGVPGALVYGAGSAGRQLANGLSMASEVQIVGYVDDDERLHGQVLNGLPIFGPHELPLVCGKHHISQIYLALPSVSRRRRNKIIEGLLPLKLQVRTLPGLSELANGQVQVSDIKELDIEDLLGRDSVVPNPLMIAKNIASKVVMVTGAGGSIGSELCRQILKAGPAKLLLVEITEFALYAIEQELLSLIQSDQMLVRTQLVPLLADVRSSARMAEIMHAWHPHTIYHAAAYKHVPLVEHNPAEGVRNNVLGTWVMAQQAQVHGVHDFVLVSTDKAVRPTNVMGASKRLAELVLQAMAQQRGEQNSGTRLSMVRFGNVLGSSGSVVPLFRKQIQQGGPITLTDARITRYFMTIPEAAQLVIQAGAMASGGDVFVLDMGESVKIMDLARKMIELSGLTVQSEENPQGDIAIEITGLRPGEKLYEELLIGGNPLHTQHPRIMKANEEFLPWAHLQPQLQKLMQAVEVNDVAVIRSLIQKLVPGYQPEGDVVDWVWLAQGQAA
jgi:FlaA1/EpsC-like NDP-sugar epimerase